MLETSPFRNDRMFVASLTDAQRVVWDRICRNADGCWVGTPAPTSNGYVWVRRGGKLVSLHRLAYTAWKGPIPASLELDHLCRNRACANPEHLEAVTHAENMRRGTGWCAENARKTLCPKGHELTGSNVVHYDRGTYQARRCRTCKNEEAKRYREAKATAGRHLVTATLTPGRTTTGLWCDRCNTSSRFVIGLYVICEFGPVHVATVNRCRNCD